MANISNYLIDRMDELISYNTEHKLSGSYTDFRVIVYRDVVEFVVKLNIGKKIYKTVLKFDMVQENPSFFMLARISGDNIEDVVDITLQTGSIFSFGKLKGVAKILGNICQNIANEEGLNKMESVNIQNIMVENLVRKVEERLKRFRLGSDELLEYSRDSRSLGLLMDRLGCGKGIEGSRAFLQVYKEACDRRNSRENKFKVISEGLDIDVILYRGLHRDINNELEKYNFRVDSISISKKRKEVYVSIYIMPDIAVLGGAMSVGALVYGFDGKFKGVHTWGEDSTLAKKIEKKIGDKTLHKISTYVSNESLDECYNLTECLLYNKRILAETIEDDVQKVLDDAGLSDTTGDEILDWLKNLSPQSKKDIFGGGFIKTLVKYAEKGKDLVGLLGKRAADLASNREEKEGELKNQTGMRAGKTEDDIAQIKNSEKELKRGIDLIKKDSADNKEGGKGKEAPRRGYKWDKNKGIIGNIIDVWKNWEAEGVLQNIKNGLESDTAAEREAMIRELFELSKKGENEGFENVEDDIVRSMADDSPFVRSRAAAIAGKQNYKSGVAPLENLLNKEDDKKVISWALQAVKDYVENGNEEVKKKYLETVKELTEDEDRGVRNAAVSVLDVMQIDKASVVIENIKKGLTGSDDKKREDSARRLKNLSDSEEYSKDLPLLYEGVKEGLDNGNGLTKRLLLQSLALIFEKHASSWEGMDDIVVECLDDKEADVVKEAVKTLSKYPNWKDKHLKRVSELINSEDKGISNFVKRFLSAEDIRKSDIEGLGDKLKSADTAFKASDILLNISANEDIVKEYYSTLMGYMGTIVNLIENTEDVKVLRNLLKVVGNLKWDNLRDVIIDSVLRSSDRNKDTSTVKYALNSIFQMSNWQDVSKELSELKFSNKEVSDMVKKILASHGITMSSGDVDIEEDIEKLKKGDVELNSQIIKKLSKAVNSKNVNQLKIINDNKEVIMGSIGELGANEKETHLAIQLCNTLKWELNPEWVVGIVVGSGNSDVLNSARNYILNGRKNQFLKFTEKFQESLNSVSEIAKGGGREPSGSKISVLKDILAYLTGSSTEQEPETKENPKQQDNKSNTEQSNEKSNTEQNKGNQENKENI